MAKVRSIFQPVYQEDRHEKEISSLLGEPADRVVMSVAFVRAEGVQQVAKGLSVNAKRTHVYVGVRNGITTAQAVVALLRAGTRVYAVDTGYGAAIFHPKFYCSISGDKARVIIGSANLTFSGLNNNLEASAILELENADPSDRSFLKRLVEGVESLAKDFPDNCYRIKDRRHAFRLLTEGLLEDERISRPDTAPTPGRPSASTIKITPKIGLKFTPVPKRSGSKKGAKPKAKAARPVSADVAPTFGPLLWEKPALPKGDLQLLTKGHISGVLRLTQAGFQIDEKIINQTTYFRNIVFGGLTWAPGPKGKEVAIGKFSVVVSGLFLGTFDLGLSHKAAWEAGQGNYTTGLHWGDATDLIKKPELIGRTLRLYGPASPGAPFVIEID